MRCGFRRPLSICLLLVTVVPTASWIDVISPNANQQIGNDEAVMFTAELDAELPQESDVKLELDGVLVHTWTRQTRSEILSLMFEDVPWGLHSFRVSVAAANGESSRLVNFSKADSAALHGSPRFRSSPSVRILAPAVNEVLEYQEEGGALLNVEVQCLDFAAGGKLGGNGGVMVVLLNGQEMYRAPSTSASFQIGGLQPGPHLLSVALLGQGGTEVVRGSLGKAGGQLMGSPEAEAAADCFAPFKVDRRVWPGARAQGEAAIRAALEAVAGGARDSEDPPGDDGPAEDSAGAQGEGAGERARVELAGAFSFGDAAAAYAAFHARALAAPPGSVPLYVYTPRDCGWGNRLIDLASAFQVAVVTERVLVLNWTEPVPLWELAASRLGAWPWSPGVREHLEAARGSYLRLDLDSLSTPSSLSELLEGYTLVEYHVGPVIRQLYDDGALLDGKVMGLMHPELGIALGECLNAVSAAPSHLQLASSSSVPPVAIQPAPLLEALLQERLRGSVYRIGVHARVTMSRTASAGGDSQIGPSSGIPLRRQGQAMLVGTVLSRLRSAPNGSHLVLATDSSALRTLLLQHPELGARTLAHEGQIVHSARERGLQAQVDMAVDWWALARSHELVLTRQSTFGYIAAGAAGVVPLTVHEHKVERRFHCGPFALCDLHPSEYGV